MMRAVSLYLPFWPADRLRRQLVGAAASVPEKPLVFAGQESSRRIIVAVNPAARALGLRPHLALAEAQARVPGLCVAPADPAADAAALERLGLWALRRYSPLVAVDPPDGLLIDVTGAAHLFGGEEALLNDLLARLGAADIHARAGLADTIGAAHALARFGAKQAEIVAPGAIAAAIGPLPVTALRLEPDLALRLERLGFETIGNLAAVPRAPLALRFGEAPLRRLDQAFGRLAEPFESIRPPGLIYTRCAFPEPIGAPETLARSTQKLVASLCGALERRGLGAHRLDLLFYRVDQRVEAIRAGTAKPLRDPVRLARLLVQKLETINPGFGIEEMVLSASLTEPLAPCQCRSFGQDAEPDLSALVDTLINRPGVTKLYRAAPAESDWPERSVQVLAPLAPPAGTGWPKHWPRPSRLLSPPEPADAIALLPDHPPAHFTWRGIRRHVAKADGPERIFGEWWRHEEETAAVRDYFLVEDAAGERFWLYHSGDGEDPATGDLRWYVHGIFA
jgi:protein ImuB